jgi:hypothetical protein
MIPLAENAKKIPMWRLWILLRKNKSTRETIALLVPIAIAVAGGLWAVFTYVFPLDKPGKVSQPAAISAGQGGVAAGRDISGSTITIGQPSVPSPDPSRR